MFTSDHGLALGQHGLLGKQNLYEHSVGVPLILAGPSVPRGARRKALCYLHDVFPTLCALAGISIPPSAEGVGLGAALHDARCSVRETRYHAYRNVQRAVRGRRFKLIEYAVRGVLTRQLFDLEADPLETRNSSDDPSHRWTTERLPKAMEEWRTRLDDHGRDLADPARVDESFWDMWGPAELKESNGRGQTRSRYPRFLSLSEGRSASLGSGYRKRKGHEKVNHQGHGTRADRVGQVQIAFTGKSLTAWGAVHSVVAKFLTRMEFRERVLAHGAVEEQSPNAKVINEKRIRRILADSGFGEEGFLEHLKHRGDPYIVALRLTPWVPAAMPKDSGLAADRSVHRGSGSDDGVEPLGAAVTVGYNLVHQRCAQDGRGGGGAAKNSAVGSAGDPVRVLERRGRPLTLRLGVHDRRLRAKIRYWLHRIHALPF